ncbi:MAG: hypothetical protein IKT53_07505 [Bacteroidaceae bacterium]|nr:hypothetical protein [Bacteroidaceae bacterium]
MKHIALTTLTVIAITLLVSCKKSEDNHPVAPEKQDTELTLYGDRFLRGKVQSIVENGDSTVFIYNSNKHVVGFDIFFDGKQVGSCKYYGRSNGFNQYYFNSTGKVTARDIVEYNENRNITLCEHYRYIYPDTTKLVLTELVFNSYDKNNRLESTFEYFSDGIPNYYSRYSYDADGTVTQTRNLASMGRVYTITKSRHDNQGNIIKVSENMPDDSPEWRSAAIEYRYDSHGNWIERRIIDKETGAPTNDPRGMDAVNDATRKIYYL